MTDMNTTHQNNLKALRIGEQVTLNKPTRGHMDSHEDWVDPTCGRCGDEYDIDEDECTCTHTCCYCNEAWDAEVTFKTNSEGDDICPACTAWGMGLDEGYPDAILTKISETMVMLAAMESPSYINDLDPMTVARVASKLAHKP